MSSEDLKSRIEALNKRPLANTPIETAPKPPASTPKVSELTHYAPQMVLRGVEKQPVVKLEDIIAGVVTPASAGPGYYHIQAAATTLEAEATFIHRRFVSLTGFPDAEAVERLARACGTNRIAPQDIVFLDLETTGLGTTPVFLIGTMECADDGFEFKQYFARNYDEETSILAAFSKRMAEAELVVTFNGKTFDVPFLKNRAAAMGVCLPEPKHHLDLLYECRRVYRSQLPNCKLQTLERCICGRCREDDIPGADIPAAYHKYVRTGDASKVSQILMHNLYDILTMADLMNRMWGRD